MISVPVILLLGAIGTACLAAGLFFLRFWRDSRDGLFLAFAVFFEIEGIIQIGRAFTAHPNQGAAWIYIIRLITSLIILFAIYKKNYGRSR